MGEKTRMPPCACPYCEHTLDAASEGDTDTHGPPLQGAVSICIECANVLVFEGEPLVLRKPTPSEMREIVEAIPHVIQMVGAAHLARQIRLLEAS